MKSREKKNNKEKIHDRLTLAIQNRSLRIATSDQQETLCATQKTLLSVRKN